ncbi:MAG: serine/threonine-protein kinase [Clostridiales bacterium]|jgi:serine/threonine protein kinase|nr:serine/threonine-protein kinase [Clostridiales bacterium]
MMAHREFSSFNDLINVNFDDMEPDVSGGSSKIYFLTISGKDCCLKKQSDIDKHEREWKLLNSLKGDPMTPEPIGAFTQTLPTANPYGILMGRLPGIRLADFLLAQSRFARSEMPSRKHAVFAESLIKKLDDFLERLHSLGYSHNDFYLHNIIIDFFEGECRPAVLDFGNATALGTPRTDLKVPNIAHAGVAGKKRFDLYTLSVMAYWIFTALSAHLEDANDMDDSFVLNPCWDIDMIPEGSFAFLTIKNNLNPSSTDLERFSKTTAAAAVLLKARKPLKLREFTKPDMEPAQPDSKLEEAKTAAAKDAAPEKREKSETPTSRDSKFSLMPEPLRIIRYPKAFFILDACWLALFFFQSFASSKISAIQIINGRVIAFAAIGAAILAFSLLAPVYLSMRGKLEKIILTSRSNWLVHLSWLPPAALIALALLRTSVPPSVRFLMNAQIYWLAYIEALWLLLAAAEWKACGELEDSFPGSMALLSEAAALANVVLIAFL